MGKIKKCDTCNTYTLQDACPECGSEPVRPGPPSFSIPDRYGEHRRAAKSGDV